MVGEAFRITLSSQTRDKDNRVRQRPQLTCKSWQKCVRCIRQTQLSKEQLHLSSPAYKMAQHQNRLRRRVRQFLLVERWVPLRPLLLITMAYLRSHNLNSLTIKASVRNPAVPMLAGTPSPQARFLPRVPLSPRNKMRQLSHPLTP